MERVRQNIRIERIIPLSFFLLILCTTNNFITKVLFSVFKYLFIFLSLIYLVKFKKIHIAKNFNKFHLIYIFLAILSIFYTPYDTSTLILSCFQFALINICVMCLPRVIFKDSFFLFMKFLEIYMCIAVLYSVILVLFGSFTYLNGFRVNYIWNIKINQLATGFKHIRLGYSSFFPNPNPFGSFCVIAASWRLVFFNKSNILDWVKIAIYAVGIYLSGSRAAYICILIAIITSIYSKIKNKVFRVSIAVFFIIILIFIIGIQEKNIINMAKNIDLAGRADAWELLIKSIREYPILGVGYGSGSKNILSSLSSSQGTFNSYLTIMAETGVVGFVIFVIYIISIIKECLYKIESKRLNRVVLNLAVIFLTTGFAETIFFNVTERWLLFIAATKCLNKCENEVINE